jgi:dipeptidyl aminopeptidase/acylaminoacyl peptidase
VKPLLLRVLATLALMGPAFGAAAPAGVPPRFPLELLFADAALGTVQISPTGRYLTFLKPRNQRMNLAILDRETNRTAWLTNMKEESVVNYLWVKPDRLMFAQQFGGRERYGHFCIDPDGGNLVTINPLERMEPGEEDGRTGDPEQPKTIISTLPKDPDHILMNKPRGRSGLGDVVKVNLRTGRTEIAENNYINARAYLADNDGVVRLAITTDFEEPVRVLYRRDAQAKWEPLADYRNEISLLFPEASPIEPHWRPVAFTKDNRTLFVFTYLGHDKAAIATYDPETRRFGDVIFTHPRVEPGSRLANYRGGGLGNRAAVAGLVLNAAGDLAGVSYTDEKPGVKWLDPDYARLARDIDAALPGTQNSIASRSKDGKLMVVLAASDRDPGTYFLYDSTKRRLTEIGRVREGIKPAQMAEMRPISFPARDSATIPGYLTLPPGRPEKNLPMIVVPHGGPFGPRDVWGYDPQVQFLANRGYAVLQVNFRGSGGYGLEFQRAGYRQWGLRMQDDVSDGVKWAVARGLADPDRVGIFGASYGGYATLAGLVFTPELYCLGINYVGVSDLDLFLFRGNADFRLPRMFREIGAITRFDAAKDKEKVNATNPINFIDRIQVPLLCAYGRNDPRVRIEHWELLETKLKKLGKPYEFLLEENEGHGFRKVENRVAFYQKVEAFLDRYMTGAGNVRIGPAKVLEMPAKPDDSAKR